MLAIKDRTDCWELAVSAPTALGVLGVAALGGKIVATTLGEVSARLAARRLQDSAHAWLESASGERRPIRRGLHDDAELAERTLERLVEYAAGDVVDLSKLPVDLGRMTQFQRRVVAACRAIRYGEVRTYGQLAARAGSPGAARAVGQVMAANRLTLVVPCHRVVASSGGLGGFSAPQGVSLKQRLLAMESRAVG
jgi:methylated-DNA-[protein]-cysteine S-methyltransferase